MEVIFINHLTGLVRVWEEDIAIPLYGDSRPKKNALFLKNVLIREAVKGYIFILMPSISGHQGTMEQ